MKKIINVLLRILDCITLRGIVEKPKTYIPDRVKYVEDYPYRIHPDKNKISINPQTRKSFDEWCDTWSVYSEDDEEILQDIAEKTLTAERDWENWVRECNGLSPAFPAVYKLDNGDYDVYIRINGEDTFGYCGHVIESNEPKNYPVGRYSERWNLRNMSIVENYGKEE